MDRSNNAIRVYFCFAVVVTIVSIVTGQGVVGESISISCGVAGTYSYPSWIKDASTIITNEGSSQINPIYAARFSYNADQKTLIVTQLESTDEGLYMCTVTGIGSASTQVTVSLSTESEKTKNKIDKEVQTANRIIFGPAEVVVTVVIIICCYILIRAYKVCKHGNKMNDKHYENKMEDKHNENKKKKKIKVLMILIVVAVLLFITVSVFFIVMQATVEDFEKLTENEHIANIALLVVESVVFVLGVIAIYPIWKKLRPG